MSMLPRQVFLSVKDDGSGRQRWRIVKGPVAAKLSRSPSIFMPYLP